MKASGWSPSDSDSLGGTDADQQQRQQAALQNVLRYLPLQCFCHVSAIWTYVDAWTPVDVCESACLPACVRRMLLKEIKHHSHSWPFADPVDTDEVRHIDPTRRMARFSDFLFACAHALGLRVQITDYLDIIKDPIDLTMIEKRLNQPNTFYKTKVIKIPQHHGHQRKIAAC